jgi:hypothetical protein
VKVSADWDEDKEIYEEIGLEFEKRSLQ